MDNEIEEFRKFLQEHKYPEALIPVECAFFGQQTKGAALRVIACTRVIEGWLNERRK